MDDPATVVAMPMDPTVSRLVRTGARLLTRALRRGPGAPSRPRRHRDAPSPTRSDRPTGSAQGAGYAGDFTGVPDITYAPAGDDRADPGEVVWAWVPYEEDHTRGKDRPVLVIGRSAGLLLALPLTSRDHNDPRDVSGDSGWVDVGTGGWDRSGRPSEADITRILQLAPDAVRRTGSALPRERFDVVARAVRDHH